MVETAFSSRARWLVVGAAALLLLAGLGNVDAWAPDEPRYLQVSEELRALEHGARGAVLLHLNGEPYGQKPPLYYWLAALAGAPAGQVGELTGRLPSALAGVALVWLTLTFGARLFGGSVGILGAGLLLTVFDFARLARRLQLDVLLALLETIGLVLYWRVDRGIGDRRRQLAGLHLALGLAVLTKGPVGFLIPVLVILLHRAVERRLRGTARELFPAWALALSLGPGLAWLALALAAAPEGFAAQMIGENLIGRFFEGSSHARPLLYYLWAFPAGFLPWSLLFPWVAWTALRRVFVPGASDETRRAWVFLLCWVGASLVFFSLSSGKRHLYLLPVFPAAALLCAHTLVLGLRGRARMPRALPVAIGAIAAAGLGLAVAFGFAALGVVPVWLDTLLRGAADGPLAETLDETRRPLVVAFACGAVGAIAAALATGFWLRRQRASALRRFATCLAAVYGIELAAFLLLFPAADALRSPRPLARAAIAASAPDQPIGLVGMRSLVGGIAYYADRPVRFLQTPAEIAAFVSAHPGAALLVRERGVHRVQDVAPAEVFDALRPGDRRVIVLRAGHS